MTGSKPCIAPPPTAHETELLDAITSLRAPAIAPAFAAEPAPMPASSVPAPIPTRGKRSEVRAAAALFVLLLGVMTIAGGAVMMLFFA